MRFGIRLLQHLGDSHELLRLAELADRAGFDQIWFPHDAFMRNTWALTSAAALRTERAKVASIATNPYTTDPSEIATYLATLDELTRGRAAIGIGMHTRQMVEWTGIDTEDYLERTREAVELVRKLLRGESADHDGSVYRWDDQCYLRFDPERRQVPIYVAAFGPEYLALTGDIGDGSLPMITPPESAPHMVQQVQRGLERVDRKNAEFDLAGCAWLSLARQRDAAEDTLRPIVAYFGPYFEREALSEIGLSPEDFDPIRQLIEEGDYDAAAAAVTESMLGLAIVGTPMEVIERIEWLGEQGLTQVNLGGPLGPDPAEAIRLMGEEVIPHFR